MLSWNENIQLLWDMRGLLILVRCLLPERAALPSDGQGI